MKNKKHYRSIRFVLILLICIGFSSLGAKTAKAYNRETDSLALVDFYNAASNHSWATNWLTTRLEQWNGVAIDNNRVVVLDLYGETINGTIPSSFGNLTQLETLYLDECGLTGTIPSGFANLSNLYDLDLSDNELSGVIPMFPNLAFLYVENNDFTFADLINYANWNGDFQYGGRAIIRESTNVNVPFGTDYTFTVSYNALTSDYVTWLPGDADRIPTGDVLSKLTFDDAGRYYCEIPNDRFPQLTLRSYSVNITVTNPYNISNSELETLLAFYISTNGDNWTNHSGWFTDTNVNNWYGITLSAGKVTYIWLGDNNLTGNIPPELENLSNLEGIYLFNNSLTGNIPKELGNLSNLRNLVLSDNSLTGIIPKELGILSNLGWLFLNDNSLFGNIPPELGNSSNLSLLWLGNNSLTGNIPKELGNLSKLDELFLNDNSLTGNIPPALGNSTNIHSLYLRNNSLTGNIPEELGNLSNLVELFINNNFLSGNIPLSLCQIIANCGSNYSVTTGNQFNTPYPCGIYKSATVGYNAIEPSVPIDNCIRQAMQANLKVEEFTNYIENCLASKIPSKQAVNQEEPKAPLQLKAYPNPARELLNIESPFENYSVTLIDYSGKEVLKQECCGNESLNVANLRKGIYLLVVESEGQQEMQKITIE